MGKSIESGGIARTRSNAEARRLGAKKLLATLDRDENGGLLDLSSFPTNKYIPSPPAQNK